MFKTTTPTLTDSNVFLILINGKNNCEVDGEWYNAYLDKPVKFKSTINLLVQIDTFLDENGFTQRSNQLRSFTGKEETEYQEFTVNKNKPDFSFFDKKGELFTARINIHSRINSTWQGDIYIDKINETFSFKSVLQLLTYITEIYNKF